MNLFKRFWNDEQGFVASADLILISVIVVLGMIVGLAMLRDEVVQELGDLATAIGQLNQSYSIAMFTTSMFSSAGSVFSDMADYCEAGTTEGSDNNSSAGLPPGCISLTAGTAE